MLGYNNTIGNQGAVTLCETMLRLRDAARTESDLLQLGYNVPSIKFLQRHGIDPTGD